MKSENIPLPSWSVLSYRRARPFAAAWPSGSPEIARMAFCPFTVELEARQDCLKSMQCKEKTVAAAKKTRYA